MPSVARSVNPGSGSAGRRFARQEEGVFSRRSPSDEAIAHRAQCETWQPSFDLGRDRSCCRRR